MSKREIILDLETTGLCVKDGHRITEVGCIEMIDGVQTGHKLHLYINPERDVPEFITELTGLTEKFLSDKPVFADVAQKIRDFIGDDTIVITCRVKDSYTLDIAFLNAELEKACVTPALKDKQWLNVRLWGEAMFDTYDEARLDSMLDHYGVDRSKRDDTGHSALLDAQLLAEIYPKLKADYLAFKKKGTKPAPPKPKR